MHNLETDNADNALEAIAIVGMSGRFPGAKNIDQFWQNLRDGIESISFFSDQELISVGVDPAVLAKPNYVKAFGSLQDIEWFDAAFFGFNSREAEVMDPQHRLFLECAWTALESAGYNPETYDGQIGVFSGASFNSYWLKNLASNQELSKLVGDYQILLGNDKDFVPTRVSYKLNLKGPSVNVSTACSTSLVAVQMACQSLLNYQCDMTLAGGISIYNPQREGYLYQEGMILSPDGHCRAFDAQSKGTIGGSGVGIVVLKRLSDAIADGDFIYAVIRGAAINNDGAMKVGYTAPSVEGQAAAISEAQAIAGIDPETLSYIEAHGTGTELGDPIEIAALTKAFRASTNKKGFCAIGSLKTNVGHLDTASGVSGLIKTALALLHKQIPPSLHFEQPNPKIDFANSPFYVNTTLKEWKRNGTVPLRAGVSSFGIGGTNAHAILEEAPEVEPSSLSRPYQLLLLSTKNATALDTATQNLSQHFQQHPNLNLADVAYTLQVGRQQFSHRRMLVCQSVQDTIAALDSKDPQRVFSQSTDSVKPVIFMFSGQGSQYVKMGQDLYLNEPLFREQLDHCSEILKPLLGLNLLQILYPPTDQIEAATQKLQQTAIAQPAIFAIEYALAQLWMSWGIRPAAMIGHSIGEYVAACLSGVFSLEDALALVAARGQLMQQLPSGAMLVVPLSELAIMPLLGQDLSLAAINGVSLCVVSGSITAIDSLEQRLSEQSLDCRRLHTSHAFHSIMMEPVLEAFRERFEKVCLHPPQIPYVSNVTGNWIANAEATNPDYWVRHIRQTVRFSEGLQQLLKDPKQVLLELGPGRTLSTFALRHPDKSSEQRVLTSIRHPQVQQSDLEFLLTTLGQLWITGVALDWSAFYNYEQRHRLPIPTYPFERQRYWIDPLKVKESNLVSQTDLARKPDIADWFYRPCWQQSVANIWRPSNISDQSCWLVFVDECGLGSQLVKRLEHENQALILVNVSAEFSQLSDRVYTLNPKERDHYDILMSQLSKRKQKPNQIVHLWSVTSLDWGELELGRVESAQELGLYSLLFLTQALEKQNFTDPLQITVLSNQMQAVTGEDMLCPEKASLLGAVKVIPLEYPHLSCRSIDIQLPQTGTLLESKLIEQILAELTTKSSDPFVAYRGFHRWVQIYTPVRLEKATRDVSRIKVGGVYLITGGLGGVGLALAENLAKTADIKLILTRRAYFPTQTEWTQWLHSHDVENQVSLKIRQLQTIEALGTEILTANVDVANFEQMQTLIAQTESRFGQINGVIHCAGVADYDGKIARRSLEMMEVMLSAKIKGTLVLNDLLQHVDLDFFVLFSSLGSVLYQLKSEQIGYTAACEFINAFAHYKTYRDHYPTIAINWLDWLEVGMSVEPTKRSLGKSDTPDTIKSFIQNSLSTVEGIEVFRRILDLDNALPQIAVSTQDLRLLEQQFSNFKIAELNRSKEIAKKADIADWFYSPEWKLTDLSASFQQVNSFDQKEIILLLCDEFGLGSLLVKNFEQNHQNVVVVKVGIEFAKIGEFDYSLNPRKAKDYDLLFRELSTHGKFPNKIVHLWSISINDHKKIEPEHVIQAQDLGFYSLLFLTQAIAKQKAFARIQINVISSNIQAVTGREALYPEATTLLGALKVISQEYSHISSRSIDISLDSITQLEAIAAKLLTELTSLISEKIVAYRNGQRWIQTLKPVQLEQVVKGSMRIKEESVYLITGGLGDIGLVLAEYLARTVRAKLVLIGRSAFPPQNEWSQWRSQHSSDHKICQKIQQLEAIITLGAKVLVIQADVANEIEMQNALDQAEAAFGQIHGVFHAAGITEISSFKAIQGIDQADCDAHFQPKIYGLLVLENLLQTRQNINFCILMSSLASVLAGPETVAYAAANQFMDSFAYWKNRHSPTSWISINWDRWQVGDREKQSTSLGTSLATFEITPKEGIDALERILSGQSLNQIIVSSGDLQSRANQWNIPEPSLVSEGLKKLELFSLYARPNLSNPYIAPRNDVEQAIATIWQQVLGIDRVGIYDNFFELNGDSLLATQTIARIRETFNVEIPLRSIFESSTVAGLSERVETPQLRLGNLISTGIEEGEI